MSGPRVPALVAWATALRATSPPIEWRRGRCRRPGEAMSRGAGPRRVARDPPLAEMRNPVLYRAGFRSVRPATGRCCAPHDLTTALPRALRRKFPDLTWRPPLTGTTDSVPAVVRTGEGLAGGQGRRLARPARFPRPLGPLGARPPRIPRPRSRRPLRASRPHEPQARPKRLRRSATAVPLGARPRRPGPPHGHR